MKNSLIVRTCAVLLISFLSACGGGGSSSPSPAPTSTTYTLSGSVSNLTSSGLTLSNAVDTLKVPPNATTIVFPTQLSGGASYNVSIVSQPLGFTDFCALTNASGTFASTNISNVTVTCRPTLAVVTTFAGGGAGVNQNGIGTSASFWSPRGVAVDTIGNVYVADSNNRLIRKITPGGSVSTFAGSGSAGNSDGNGVNASFTYPVGVAVDASGNVYVADYYGNIIRKITSAGVVTTLAGSGVEGKLDGTGVSASFSGPSGITVDTFGNVYVADTLNHSIRKISTSGQVTTIAGSGFIGNVNGTGIGSSFFGPAGIVVDPLGNLYVGDTNNDMIRKITPAGVVTTFAGGGSFNSPQGLALDAAGNIYVADVVNQVIEKITPAGVVSILAGNGVAGVGGTNGAGTSASFYHPIGVAVDSSGNVFVVELGNNQIRKISPQ